MNINKRSLASSVIQFSSLDQAIWNDWNTRKAVKEGYQVSGWVFKAISLIVKHATSVSWHVEDLEGTIIEQHPVTQVLRFPNNQFSESDFFELLISWQQLSGKAFASKVVTGGRLQELWPISPDRMAPIRGKGSTLISGYKILDDRGQLSNLDGFNVEDILYFRLLDPSDPIEGIGPLQVAARAVDTDVDQVKWNKSAMQNRGILDGVFTFDRDLDPSTYGTIKQKIKELFQGPSNARDIGVIGSNAKYQRLSLTPAEMDFITSRKFNMEEIFIIFGIPPQLAGSQEAMTFNNYATSMRIFWELTIIPLLRDLQSTFNFALSDQLGDGFKVGFDLSKISALKQDQKMLADTAKVYFDMGVPVATLNEFLTLGIPEYEGWDRSVIRQISVNEPTQERSKENRKVSLLPFEKRNIDNEIMKKERMAKRNESKFSKALKVQQDAAFSALESNQDIRNAVVESSDELKAALSETYQKTAESFAGTVIVDERGIAVDYETRRIPESLRFAIEQLISNEAIILTELSLLNKITADAVIAAAIDGEAEGKSVNAIQQAILDTGTFSSERALRISRTISGTAQSLGQIEGAKSAGATRKTWHDSGFEVRQEHQNRNGETVDINSRFSQQFPDSIAPRWPLDQEIAAADRINCRCSLSFEIL